MICGVLKPDSGSILIDDVAGDSLGRKRRVGALLDHMGIYSRLTVRENLVYFGRLQGMSPDPGGPSRVGARVVKSLVSWNARHTKTLPGRKTDVQECQWLQKLHTFGLLNDSFRPAEEIRVLRGYLRQRENLVAAAATCIQHMQKALTEMNSQGQAAKYCHTGSGFQMDSHSLPLLERPPTLSRGPLPASLG
jgi:ABC-type sugar transport system ATPase subunit